MTLTEFLLARIAEDEEVARAAGDSGPVMHGRRSELSRAWDRDYGPEVGTVEIDSARVLAECEAKRRIVDEHWAYDDTGTCNVCTDIARGVPSPCPTLRILAAPYADHPDYRAEWKQ